MTLNKHGNHKRILPIDKIAAKFEKHQKLHDFEVDELFKDIPHNRDKTIVFCRFQCLLQIFHCFLVSSKVVYDFLCWVIYNFLLFSITVLDFLFPQ